MTDHMNDSAEIEHADELLVLEEAPAELVLEVWEPTGDTIVDSSLERLRALETSELGEHVEIFGSIHDELRARLTDLSDNARS